MYKRQYNNVILITGSGRNSGKTTIACHIIKQLSEKSEVIGLKISPHFHLVGKGQELIVKNQKYSIYREHGLGTRKDSSRMLFAGAKTVYFIQCTDENLEFAKNDLIKILVGNMPVVCESGSFSKVFTPGYQILVIGDNPDKTKKSFLRNLKTSDLKIMSNDFSQDWFRYKVGFTLNKGFKFDTNVTTK